MQFGHFTFGEKGVVLLLPETKSGARSGAQESVFISDMHLVSLLRQVGLLMHKGDLLIPMNSGAFRVYFAQLVTRLGLPETFTWKPYSLRRGGATHFFRYCGLLDKLCTRGRWAHQRTCCVYINKALAAQADLEVPKLIVKRIQTLAYAW